MLQAVAAATEGFAGADLQALCAGAVMAAVRRTAPQLLEPVLQDQGMDRKAAEEPIVCNDTDSVQQAREEVMSDCLAGSRASASAQRLDLTPEDAVQLPGATGTLTGNCGTTSAADKGDSSSLPSSSSQPSGPIVAREALAREGTSITDVQSGAPVAAESAIAAQIQQVHVRASDWRDALLAAAEPCSRRQGLPALSAGAIRAMPLRLVPALLPSFALLLRVLHSSGLPLPAKTARPAAIAAMHEQDSQGLEDLAKLQAELVRAGVIETEGGPSYL